MKNVFFAIIIAVAGLFSPPAKAEDLWGCEVLLCLANPRGPMAVAECVAPIKRLYRALTKPHPDPFPSCKMASGNGTSRNEGVLNSSYYPLCPSGLTPLAPGAYVRNGANLLEGFGDGMPTSSSADDQINRPLTQMACVGQLISSTVEMLPDGFDGYKQVIINEYSPIVFMDPIPTGRVIDVYINGSLVNRVGY